MTLRPTWSRNKKKTLAFMHINSTNNPQNKNPEDAQYNEVLNYVDFIKILPGGSNKQND